MDYFDGITKAVQFIEENLDNDISCESVAMQIGFSAFHFHRIFKAMTGETIAEHTRKRRLAKSARQLISSDKEIMTIALEARFESQESFTRAFKKMFGETPNVYRKKGKSSPIVGYEMFEPELLIHLKSGVNMEPKFVEKAEQLAVGMAGAFHDQAFTEISKMWVRFKDRQSEIKSQVPGYALGVCMMSHPDVDMKPEDTFIYLAALPVTSVENLPQGMVSCRIPASRYAVFTHKGPLADLPQTIRYIWGTWVPRNSDLQKKNAPDFELYDERFNAETLDGEFDIYVAVN